MAPAGTVPRAQRARRVAGRFALALTGLAVALMAAEVALRRYGIGSPTSGVDVHLRWEPGSPYLQRDAIPTTVFSALYDGAQVYRSVVSGEEVHRASVRTSSSGLRGGDPDPRHTLPRILGIGDSLTFGQGVEEEDTFLQVFGRRAPRRVEVLNAGVPSWNLASEVAWLHELGWAQSPDLVLLCTYVNDVEPSVMLPPEGADRPILLLAPAWAEHLSGLRAWSNVVNLLSRRLDRERTEAALTSVKASRRKPQGSYLDELRGEINVVELREQYALLKASCDEQGVPCLVVMLPVLVDGLSDPGTDLVDQLASAAASTGLAVLRVDRALDELTPFDRYVLPSDQHPSRASHAAIGAALAVEIARLGTLDGLTIQTVE